MENIEDKKSGFRVLNIMLAESHFTRIGNVDFQDSKRFLRHSQLFEQLFMLINTKEVFLSLLALQYR